MAKWKMTVRDGSDVSRMRFDDLDKALDSARTQIDEIISRPPLGTVKAIRDYDPEKLVKARIEISGKGLLSPPTAGIDVRGDNTLAGYTGAVSRKPIEAGNTDQVFDALREALAR